MVSLGAGAGVGKSAMTTQLVSSRFPEGHDPTIEGASKTRIRMDEPASLDILDTAEQAEFTAGRDHYLTAGERFFIRYSATDRTAGASVKFGS
ncbi:GTP-binding protein Rit1 [Heterocephalus glaber]|uniref:GTP-binding protein Rit1 n=1 Tax=Heterocephalus glaber TaxID=10181 RepID=G5AP33_HETGA|nr:GTP-binding protein Rit1 [Heterocephalus glaber]